MTDIPQKMRKLDQWVVWKHESVNGKKTKVLYNPRNSAKRASSTDSSTWGTFAQAYDTYNTTPDVDGVGFVFTKESGIVGIDLDHPNEETEPIFNEILDKFDTYKEVSPSGLGYHIYAVGVKTTPRSKDTKLGIEFYDSGRFFTVTGNSLTTSDVKECQEAIDWFENKFFPPEKKAVTPITPKTASMDDQHVIDLMFSAANGYDTQEVYYGKKIFESRSELDGSLAKKIAFFTKDPDQIERIMRTSPIAREKWDRGDGYLKYHIRTAIENTPETYTPPEEFDIRELMPVVFGSDDTQEPKLIMKTKDGREKVTKKQNDLTVEDFEEILEHLGYKFKLNTLNDEQEVNGRDYNDVFINVVGSKLDSLGITNASRRDRKIWEVCFKNRYNPIKQYLDGLEWDGKDHIGELSSHFSGEDGLFPKYLKKWLVASVAKIYEGSENKVFIINGPQDIGKSFFAEWLGNACEGGKYFSDSSLDPDDKDTRIRMTGKWIWEISELGGVAGKTSSNGLKYLLTTRKIEERKSYGKKDTVKKAITNFIGTVNDASGFLNDPTGSRRFIVCTVDEIDQSYSKKLDPNKVWAQVKHLYDSGYEWRFTKEEKAESEKNNQKYEVYDALEDLVDSNYDFSDPEARIDADELRIQINDLGWRESPNKMARRLGFILKKKRCVRRRGSDGARFYEGIKKKNNFMPKFQD